MNFVEMLWRDGEWLLKQSWPFS